MALLLGRDRGPRRLVRPARRAVAAAAARGARRGRALGERLSRRRARPAPDRRPGLSASRSSCLVWAAALFGDTDPFRNLAPTWIYVIFWLGRARSCRSSSGTSGVRSRPGVRSRTRSSGSASGAGARRGRSPSTRSGSGAGPAAVAIFAFVALELAYADPASPRALAFAIALYTYVALFGMAAFGRDTWERTGEGFAVLFGLLARLAPLHVESTGASGCAGRSPGSRARSRRRERSPSSR